MTDLNIIKKNFLNVLIALGFIISLFGLFFKDFQTVLYEGELEQLFSYLFIKDYGRPYLTNHPGGIIYFINYFIFSILQFENISIRYNVIILRLIYFLFSLAILIFGSNLAKKHLDIDINKKILLFFFLFPIINFWFYNTYFYLLVFSFGYITIVLIEIFFKKNKFLPLVIFFLGFMLSIYIGSITLFGYFLLRKVWNYQNIKKKITDLIIYSFLIFFIYLIITAPIFPDSFHPIKIIIANIIFLIKNYFILFCIFLIAITFFFLYSQNIYIDDKKFKIYYLSSVLSLPFLFKIVPFIIFENYKYSEYLYFMSLLSFRITFPILSLFIFFEYKFLKDNLKIFFLIIFFLISSFNMLQAFKLKNYNLDNFIDKNYNNFKSHNIYFFQNSKFSSEYRFLAWGHYKYANLSVDIPSKWLENKLKNFSSITLREYKMKDYELFKVDNKEEKKIEKPDFFLKVYFLKFFAKIDSYISQFQGLYLKHYPKKYVQLIDKPIEFCADEKILKNIGTSVVIFEQKYDQIDDFNSLLVLLRNCKKIKTFKVSQFKDLKIIKF